ncbi:MAG: LysM peptidoglycan-binding domain-containing protein, partial [Acetivibrionales bacterium]
PEPEYISYTVVKGDCLWTIAQRFLGDGRRYVEIYELNKDQINNPDIILISQQFRIPVKK